LTELTFYVQCHGVALAVAFLVAADARVDTGTAPRHLLQNQALIADYRARGWIVVQQFSLSAVGKQNKNTLKQINTIVPCLGLRNNS
jgi:hypothetical protein